MSKSRYKQQVGIGILPGLWAFLDDLLNCLNGFGPQGNSSLYASLGAWEVYPTVFQVDGLNWQSPDVGTTEAAIATQKDHRSDRF